MNKRFNVPAEYMAHETIMESSHLANDSLTLKLLEPFDGEDDVDVLIGVRVVVIVMGYHQVAHRPRDLNNSE